MIKFKDKRFTGSHLDPKYYGIDDLDAIVDRQIEDFAETVKPYIRQEQWLGLGRGNHDDAVRIRCGTDPQERLARRLGTVDLGYSCLLLLVLRKQTLLTSGERYGKVKSIKFYLHHGWGGGSRTTGGDLTKFERLILDFSADIYLTGHTHKPFAMPMPRIGIDNAGKMASRDRWMANTGSFMKLLSDGPVPSWAETKVFRVVKLGGIVWNLTPLNDGWLKIAPEMH